LRSTEHRGWLQELDLDVSTEELLSAERAYTYADLHAMLGRPKTVMWLHNFGVSDEAWDTVCNSLKTHPTLEILNFRSIQTFAGASLAPAVLESRIQAFVDVLKVNTSIHTIPLLDHYTEHELFRASVIPYLETNRLRPRLRAIQKTRPIAYRVKVVDGPFLLYAPMQTLFGCFYQGMPKLPFRRRLRRPRRLRPF
jgi:hypothetical protein